MERVVVGILMVAGAVCVVAMLALLVVLAVYAASAMSRELHWRWISRDKMVRELAKEVDRHVRELDRVGGHVGNRVVVDTVRCHILKQKGGE